ncbi:MAG: GNAT family N-acetyltransferase [Saprospiraceae bacterium]|nr:GNAT family N-acetyltransferase [Saprospiraceae bacterium]
MMDFIVNYAKALRISAIWWGVRDHNPEAIRFYEKHGFSKVGDHHCSLGQSIQLDFIFERRI